MDCGWSALGIKTYLKFKLVSFIPDRQMAAWLCANLCVGPGRPWNSRPPNQTVGGTDAHFWGGTAPSFSQNLSQLEPSE